MLQMFGETECRCVFLISSLATFSYMFANRDPSWIEGDYLQPRK